MSWCDQTSDPMYEIVREAEEVLIKKTLHFTQDRITETLFITEAASFDPVNDMLPRFSGDWLSTLWLYTANGGISFPLFGPK